MTVECYAEGLLYRLAAIAELRSAMIAVSNVADNHFVELVTAYIPRVRASGSLFRSNAMSFVHRRLVSSLFAGHQNGSDAK